MYVEYARWDVRAKHRKKHKRPAVRNTLQKPVLDWTRLDRRPRLVFFLLRCPLPTSWSSRCFVEAVIHPRSGGAPLPTVATQEKICACRPSDHLHRSSEPAWRIEPRIADSSSRHVWRLFVGLRIAVIPTPRLGEAVRKLSTGRAWEQLKLDIPPLPRACLATVVELRGYDSLPLPPARDITREPDIHPTHPPLRWAQLTCGVRQRRNPRRDLPLDRWEPIPLQQQNGGVCGSGGEFRYAPGTVDIHISRRPPPPPPHGRSGAVGCSESAHCGRHMLCRRVHIVYIVFMYIASRVSEACRVERKQKSGSAPIPSIPIARGAGAGRTLAGTWSGNQFILEEVVAPASVRPSFISHLI